LLVWQAIRDIDKNMQKKMIEFNLEQRKAQMPELQSGDVVKVYRRIVEGGKERIQIFEGMIIAMRGGQSSSPTITVRKVSNGVGVELVLPIYSPMIEKIEMVKRAKVRRSKLYYVREKTVKALKLKYKELAELIARKEEKEVVAEKVEEKEVEVEEKKEEVAKKETQSEEKVVEEKKEAVEKTEEKK